MGRHRSPENRRLGEHVQVRSNGILELRYPLPEDVRAAFPGIHGQPRKEIIQSLKTRDPKLANERADRIRADLREAIHRLRATRSSPALPDYLRNLYANEMAEFERTRQDDERRRRAAMFSPPGAAVVSGVGTLAERLAELERTRSIRPRDIDRSIHERRIHGGALLSEDPAERRAVASWAADGFFQLVLGREPQRDNAEYEEVLTQCAEVLIDALVRKNDLDQGSPPTPPQSLALREEAQESPDGNVATSDRGKLRLFKYHQDVYGPSLTLSPSSRGARTADGKRTAVRLFTELIGDKPLYLITTSDLWEFHDRLLEQPNPQYLTGPIRKLTAPERLAAASAAEDQFARLHPKTVNKHLSGIKTMLTYAVKRRDIRLDVGGGVRAEYEDEEDPGRSFTTDELNRIFHLPLFSGCMGDKEHRGLLKAGNINIRDDRFWIPLVLFLSGGRSSEIAGLTCADVVVDHEVPHMLIRPNGIRSLKNKQSKRMIPIHPHLEQIGFPAFARRRLAASGATEQFFPMAEGAEYHHAATDTIRRKAPANAPIMRAFNRTHLDLAKATDNHGSMKCFRHTFEQESLAKIESDEIRRRLTGREVESSAKIYAVNIPDDLAQRNEQLARLRLEIAKMTFSRVGLDHLYMG